MRAVFDKTELLVLLQDFYELTGLRTVVFDEWGMDIPVLSPAAAGLLPAGTCRPGGGAGLPAV